MKRLDFIALVAWIALSLSLAFLAFSLGGVDFGVYYAAGRVALQGGNPYDYQQLTGQIVSATGKINNPYYYAPWFTWALFPLVLLPYKLARAAWAVINLMLWIAALFNLAKLIPRPPAGWKRWGMYALVTFMFAWSTWGFEQVGILIFFLLTLAMLAILREKWVEAGLWLALLLFKPNITLLPVLAVAAWLLLRRQFKPVAVMGIAVLAMLAVSLVLSPGWYRALIQSDKLVGLSYTLDTSGGTDLVRHNTTLMDWLATYGVTGGAANVIYAAVALLGVALAAAVTYRSRSIQGLAALILPLNFAILPYALFYDYPSLVLTLFYANALPVHSGSERWLRLGLNAFIALSLFIGDSISYRYWIVIALALLLAVSYGQRGRQAGDWIPTAG